MMFGSHAIGTVEYCGTSITFYYVVFSKKSVLKTKRNKTVLKTRPRRILLKTF